MSETIKSNQSQDDQVAQAWADATSTFTERTGLELPDDASKSESDSTKEDDWLDDWNDVWDTDWGEEDDPEDWFTESRPKSRYDKYQYDWDDESTPAQLEFERVKKLKQGAEEINRKRFREIQDRRRESDSAIEKYRNSGKFSSEQIDKISQYLDEYIIGTSPINKFFLGILGEKTDEYKYGNDVVFGNPQLLEESFDYDKKLERMREAHPREAQDLENGLSNYERFHGIDSERLKAFQDNVEPLVLAHDSEVAPLFHVMNNISVVKDRFGVGDYTIHCLVQKVNPSNLNELLMGRRELPTTDQHRLEQNRIDALELQGTLYKARDFIHDEFPGVHELLSAMLEYYDSRNDNELHQVKKKQLEDIVAERASNSRYYNVGGELAEYVFDLTNYEKKLHPRKLESSSTTIGGDRIENVEPAVDCLRRLAENTNPDRLTPPETKYPELNELMQKLRINQNEKTGETHVDWHQAGELVGAINQILVDSQGKHGLYPSTIEAVAFAERIATFALRDITKRDWHELPYDPGFKEIVRFSQLAYSGKPYDARKFERFWNGFQDIPNGDLSDDNLQNAYGKLQRLILANLSGLADKYSKNHYTTERTKALWSGNLIRELIGLADLNASRKQ